MTKAENIIRYLPLGGVISVIGIALFAKTRRQMTTCKKPSSQVSATSLAMAVEHFFTEYGKLPDVDSRISTDSKKGVELLNILSGLEPEVGEIQNPRRIRFLSVKEGKGNRDGLIYDSSHTSIKGLYDTWGHPFTVVLGSDSDEALRFEYGSRTAELKECRVAVFGSGEDGELWTQDDIKTW